MKGLRFIVVVIALMFISFSNVSFAGIGVTDESHNQQVADVSAVEGVLQAFIDAENANYAPEKVATAFDLLTKAVQSGKIPYQTTGGIISSIFSGLDLRSIISSMISMLQSLIGDIMSGSLQGIISSIVSQVGQRMPASVDVSAVEGVLQAFIDAENANYAPEKVAAAFDLLTKAVQSGKIPYQATDGILSSIFSSLDLRGVISSIISMLTGLVNDLISGSIQGLTSVTLSNLLKPVSAKDVQYSYTMDLIGVPLGAIIVPLMGILDSILIPILPGGTMPSSVTSLMMSVGFPAIDFLLNTLPILRPVMMDFMAPIMSHMH